MRICIVLPTLDEGPLLAQTVDEVAALLQEHDVHFIIAASATLTTPGTYAVIETLAARYGNRLEVFNQSQPGVGSAIREGFARAQGEAVVLMTSDLETPPAILPDMIKKLEEGYDVATATRWRYRAFRGYPPFKIFLNFLFQQFFRVLYFTLLSDLTYGYRVFRTSVVKKILWEETRHPFFFETTLKPLRLGYRIAEVPVTPEMFVFRESSRGRATLKDLIAYVKLGLRIRFSPKARMRV